MECNAVRHRAPETGDLGTDDIIVVNEQRGSTRLLDKAVGRDAADHQLPVARGKVRRDRSGRLHSRPPSRLRRYSAAMASYSCAARYFSASSAAMQPVPAAVTAWR